MLATTLHIDSLKLLYTRYATIYGINHFSLYTVKPEMAIPKYDYVNKKIILANLPDKVNCYFCLSQ